MKLPIKIVAVSGILLGALSIAGIAYALTAASFESRAQAWADAVCKQSLLDSKNTTANNQTIAICQAYLKGKENGATLASQQLSINNLLNVIPTPGPKGDTGAPGEAGPKGDRGDVGPKGDTGATIGPMLVDANGVALGVPIQDGVFYNPQLKRNIAYGYGELGRYLRNNSVQGSFAYTGNDCTGTLYLKATDPAIDYTWVHALNGNYYIVANSTPVTSLQMRSQIALGSSCGSIDSASTPWNVYALERVELPFDVPIAMPLYYK